MSVCLVYKRMKQQINYINCDGKDKWIDTCNYKITDYTGQYNGDLSELGTSCDEIRKKDYFIGDCITEIPNMFFYNAYNTNTVVNIPESVKTIGWYAFQNSNVTEVNISSPFTEIGNSSFKNCYNLRSINLPNALTSIGAETFDNCYRLTNIDIPSSVVSIDNYAFRDCSGLTSVTFGENSHLTNIGYQAFYDCSGLTSMEIPSSVTSIGNGSFQNCSKLTSITIPSGVTSIDNYAFRDCSGLTSVTFAENSRLTSIGDDAFDGCSGLTSIEIPRGVKSIGNYAFDGCSELTSVTIPRSVTAIGDYAFRGCSKITDVYYDGTCDEWAKIIKGTRYGLPNVHCKTDDYYIYYTSTDGKIVEPYSATSIGTLVSNTYEDGQGVMVFEDQITNIGANAFRACDSIKRIKLPSSVTSIGKNAFDGCTSLTSVNIPSDVTEIDDDAFTQCYELASIEIPSSVTSIGNRVFYSCDNLTNVIIDEKSKLTRIGEWAFCQCINLTNIEIPSSVKSIGARALGDCRNLAEIFYYDNCFEWNKIEKGVAWDDGMPSNYVVHCTPIENKVLYYTTYDGNYTNPSWLSSFPKIVSNTYEDGQGVMIFESDLTSISSNAFYNSTLTNVEFGGNTKITIIGDSAFYGCSGLTSISLPSTVTSIGINAFYNCINLQSINYNGTSNQFRAITKGSSWNSYVPDSCIVHCTDGDFRITNFIALKI